MDLNAILTPLADALRVQSLNPEAPAAIPENMRVESLEQFLNSPRRARGEVKFGRLGSLLEYVEQHHSAGETAIFADADTNTVRATMNWHDANRLEAGWGDHVADYALKHTREYVAWTGISGKPLRQVEFAEFLEENLASILTPEPADLLDAVSRLSGKKNTTFEMGKRLDNGDTQIEWKEDTVLSNGAFPSRFVLKLPVFRGAEAATTFEVNCLLRYRVNEGKLSYEVKLLHLDLIKDMAFEELLGSIRSTVAAWTDKETPVFIGSITKRP